MAQAFVSAPIGPTAVQSQRRKVAKENDEQLKYTTGSCFAGN